MGKKFWLEGENVLYIFRGCVGKSMVEFEKNVLKKLDDADAITVLRLYRLPKLYGSDIE